MKERIVFLDWAKFIGLCLVVYGHIPPTANMTHTVIYSFHMPFFFFVSGMLFNPERFTIKKNLRSLLIPYFAFSFLVVALRAAISLILYRQLELSAISDDILSVIIGSSSTQCPYTLVSGPAWFLLALFWIRLNAWDVLKLKTPLMAIVVVLETLAILVLQAYL